MVKCGLWLSVLALTGAVLAAEAPGGAGEDPIMGAIDEGKVYRKVDGYPITGRQIADVLIEEKWKSELEIYCQRIVTRDEAARQGIVVAEKDIDAELNKQAQMMAAQAGQDPKHYTLDEMARALGMPLNFLRENMRDTLALFQLLVKEGKLKADANLLEPQVRQALVDRLDVLQRQRNVVMDPDRLAEGEAARIGGVGHGRDRVRAFVQERLGALQRSEIVGVLDKLALHYIAERALKAAQKTKALEDAARAAGFANQKAYAEGAPDTAQKEKYEASLKAFESSAAREALTREDRIFHFSYRARAIEAEQDVPSGQQVLKQQLQSQGMTEEQFIKDRTFTIDAMFTALARSGVRMADIRAEWDAQKARYQRREQKLAHIFIRVRDPQGQPYAPNWQVPNNPQLNEYVAKIREERFAKARQLIEALQGPAQASFEATAKASSEDDRSKANGGLIGRVGPNTVVPESNVDRSLYAAAKDLKPGEISGPVRSDYGWHILRCLENQETSFEEAQERVYLELLKRKRHELFEALTRKAEQKDFF